MTAVPALTLALIAMAGGFSVVHAADADADGVPSSVDCNDADPFAWSASSQVTSMSIGSDRKTFHWSAPGAPGSVSVSYDLLRSASPANFVAGGSCELAGVDAPVAADAAVPAPGQVFFYLARAVNACGEGSLGAGSNQPPRPGKSCRSCAGGCDDGDACTTDTCGAGACQHAPAVPRIKHGPQDATACAGGAAVFEVRADGQGTLHYAWTIGGVPAGTDSPVLSLPSVGAGQDGAVVACTVSSGACGGTSVAQAKLFVFPTSAACSGGNDGFEAASGATFPPSDPNPASAPSGVNAGKVIPATGEYRLDETDFVLPGRGIDFTWTRAYRSRSQRFGALGYNWTHGYETSVSVDPNDAAKRLVVHPDGSVDRFTSSGPSCWQTTGRFDQLCMLGDGRYELTTPDGMVSRFRALTGTAAPGRLERLADRNGNALTLAFDGTGNLTSITDTLGRVHTLSYDAVGLLTGLHVSTGQTVGYAYHTNGSSDGAAFDLASATLPATAATPTGATIRYTYSINPTDPRLAHNLLTRTDELGVAVVDTAYNAATGANDPAKDRVTRQEFPDGTSIAYAYTAVTPGPSNNNAVTSTTIRDRAGNVRTLFYDAKSQLVLDRVSSGRAPDTNRPSAGSYNAPGAPVRAGDPPVWETRHAYNADGLRTSSVLPEGNDEQLTYDSANPSRRQQGNLLQQVRNPGPRGADQPNLTESWIYGTPFGGSTFWTTYTDPKGRTTQRTFDGSGNVSSRTEPTVTDGVLGGGSLTVQESWSYNAAGQVSGHVAPNGRTDAFTYHTSGPQAGYLASEVTDQGGRNLTTSYTWDASGNVIAKTDATGATTQYAYDGRNQLIRTQATAPFGYVTLIERDAAGRQTEVAQQNVDETGALRPNAWIIARSSYDDLGRLVSEKREGDNETLIGSLKHYDANGNVTKVESAAALAGDPTGSVEVTLYDTRGKPWKTTRGFGTASATTDEIVYDGNGDVAIVRHGLEGSAGPSVTTTTRDGYNRPTSVVDPMGVTSHREFDATGHPVSEWVNGAGGLELSRRTTYYNQRDLPYRTDVAHFGPGNVAIGDGQSTTLRFFDAMGNQVGTTDDGGAQTVSTYERPNWLASQTDALSNATTFTRNAAGQVVSSTSTETSTPGGQQLASLTQGATSTPGATFTQTQTFDLLRRQTSQTDSAGNTTENVYDSRNNVVKTIDANGNVVLYTYDTHDRLVRTDATMTSNGTGSGTPIGTVTTRQEFDADGRMVKKFDPNGNVTAFHYDPLGRLVQTDFADGTHETDAYDRYGNLSRTTDANGTVAEMTYDLSGRMTERTITRAAGIEGATFENYQYDGLGQITHAENDHSVVSLTYDSQGKVLSETSVVDDVSVTTSASYDGLGNQRTLTYPSGFTVNRTYDALHRVVGIEDDTRSLANYTWIGPNTRRETIVFGNGARVDYAFDTLGRVTRMTHVGSSGLPFEDRQYGWDNTSHVTSHDNLLFSTTHYLEYDSFYRLRQSVKPGETVNYELDAAGNRTSVSGGFAAGGYSVVPASMNQYAATPGDTRTYDNAGNLLQIDADATDRHLTFDYRGRITGVSGDGVPTTTFWYDALGRRIDKESAANGETTRTNFRNFGSDIVEVRFEDGTAGGHRVVDYVHGALLDEIVRAVEVQGPVCACTKDYRPVTCNGVLYNNPCLAACAGCVDGTLLDGYWPHADLNGNVIAMLDASGKLIERFTYDDYGQPTVNPAIGPGCPACTKDFKPVTCGGVVYPNACLAACAGCSHTMDVTRSAFLFQGRLYDPETGLYDFRNRSYDPMSGRFVSRDPLGLWGDPIELGVGDAFVGNDPWNSTDPFGNYRKAGDTFTDCQDKCIDAYVNTSVVHEIFYAIDIFGSADIGCKLFCSSAWPWPAPGSLVTFKNPSDGGWSRYNTGGIYKDLIKVQTKLDVNPSGGVWSINQHSTDHYQNVLNLKTSPTWGPVGPWRPRPSPFPWPLPPGSPGPTIPYPDFPDPSAMQISSPNAQAAGKPYLDWCECCRSTGNWICCLACFTGAENPGSYSHAPISAMTTWSTCESEGPVEVPGVGPVLGTSDKLCPGSAHCTYRYPAAGSK